jgi:hypothetical protein
MAMHVREPQARRTKDDKYNSKRSVNREEWITAIVNIALNKYMGVQSEAKSARRASVAKPRERRASVLTGDVPGVVISARAAFERFVVEDLRPYVADGCFHDANLFREEFCYTTEAEDALRRYEQPLRLIFDTFAQGDGAVGDELRTTKTMDVRRRVWNARTSRRCPEPVGSPRARSLMSSTNSWSGCRTLTST